MTMKLPASFKERVAWLYVVLLEILFLCLYLLHTQGKPAYTFIETLIFAWMPDVIAGPVAMFFIWGAWAGTTVLVIEVWLFRNLDVFSRSLLVVLTAMFLGAQAGYDAALHNFAQFKWANVFQGTFVYLAIFLVPVLVILSPLVVRSALNKVGLIR